MRGGPGLGNIAGAQGDYFQATKGGGHGDYNMVCLAPASVQEMFDFTYDAFDIAQKYTNPVMILTDGIIGQMMEPIIMERKKIAIDPDANDWTLRGAKARAPRSIRSLFLKEGVLEEWNKKLQVKFALMRKNEVKYETYKTLDADLVFCAYGTCARIARAACDVLRKSGVKAGIFRPISLWPFPYAELANLDKGKQRFFVLEMSAGQMLYDIKLAIKDDKRVAFYGRMGGGVPEENEVVRLAKKILHT